MSEGAPGGVPALPPEETARAALYALLARLFYAGPDADLLAAIASADEMAGAGESALTRAWHALQAASAAIDPLAARQEYDELFVSVGQAPVSIYASHYLSESWKEHTLVNLRDELARLGLARQPGAVEPEDHLAGLLDVMRHLILSAALADAAAQEGFFRSYLAPWYRRFGAAVAGEARANYYRRAAELLVAFLDIDVECFQIA